MDFEELKKRREKNFKGHKQKKRAYYLKSKLRKEIDYEDELKEENFLAKMKEIAKSQKLHMDSRQESIRAKIEAYRELKKEYYEKNREKRLEYDKEYREKKKEELREYRKKYYEKLKKERLKEA